MGRTASLQRHAYRAALWVAVVVLSLPVARCLAGPPDPLLKPPAAQIQRRALIATVSRMDRGNSAGGDVYFVGFAGFGEQKVFRKEAELAQQVFRSRYATGSRSLLLVNDSHDRRTYPLATYDNLRTAVVAIGQRMHRDRDTLILLLTSHGNDEDGVAITNGRMPEDALSPKDVRKILNESHIRWRILIVSACYSGIFVPVLKNDSTLIITAADAYHSSFGCDDTRDLTWFGEALLKDALPHACSLPAAYADMARIIRRRETDQGEIHSNPKLYVGPQAQPKLLQLDAPAAASCKAQPAQQPPGH